MAIEQYFRKEKSRITLVIFTNVLVTIEQYFQPKKNTHSHSIVKLLLQECLVLRSGFIIIIFIAQIISGERLGVTLILDDPAGNSYMQVGVQRITCLPSVLRVLILAY